MIIVQLNSSLHIAQVRMFLWQRTILVNVPTFGRSENYDGGKFMRATWLSVREHLVFKFHSK